MKGGFIGLKYYIHYNFLVDLAVALMNRMASMVSSLGLVAMQSWPGQDERFQGLSLSGKVVAGSIHCFYCLFLAR